MTLHPGGLDRAVRGPGDRTSNVPVRKHKPTSPGRRFATWADNREVTKAEPEKSLTEGLSKSGGRNSKGRVTSRHRGGGAKRRYRKIDFKRLKDGVPAKVAAIEYDPNRSAHIALLHYADGEKRYILAPARLRVGATVQSGDERRHPARQLPAAARRSRPARPSTTSSSRPAAAASSAARPAPPSSSSPRRASYATLRLPSTEMRMVPVDCRATVGALGNAEHELVDLGKAGRSRHQRQAPADARRGHEPGRPPARRRRGAPHARRPSRSRPGACRRSATARARSARPPTVHRPRPAARQEGQAVGHVALVQEGPVGRGAPARRASRP